MTKAGAQGAGTAGGIGLGSAGTSKQIGLNNIGKQQGYQNALQALNLGGGAIPPQLQSASSLAALTKAFSQLPGSNPYPGASALTNLMQLVNAGNVNNPQQTTPSYLDSSSYISPVPDNQAIDLSSIYQPDYANTAADTGGYGSE